MISRAKILEFLSLNWLTGPILSKELRTTCRKGRYYSLRVVYLGLLVAFMAIIWLEAVRQVNPATAEGQEEIAQSGRTIVSSIVWFQLVAMQLFAVILMSDSISGEITGRTIDVLMTTPITSLQIVVGKLLSGMLHIFLLLAISLPLLAMVRVLGGVPWDYLVAGLLITLCASLLAGTLSMLLSIRFRRPYVTIALTMLIGALFYGFTALIGSTACICLFGPFSLVDPFSSLAYISSEFISSRPLKAENWIIPCITMFCVFEGLLCVCVLWVSRLALRRDLERNEAAAAKSRKDDLGGELTRLQAAAGNKKTAMRISVDSPPPIPAAQVPVPPAQIQPSARNPANQNLKLAEELLAASAVARSERMLELDFRPISQVKCNPVLWRELNQVAGNWSSWTRWFSLYLSIPLVIYLLTVRNTYCFAYVLSIAYLGVVGFLVIASNRRSKHLVCFPIATVGVVIFMLAGPVFSQWGLLLFCALATAIPASTSIAAEKESRSLELLYTTALGEWGIIFAKAAGVFLKSWPIWLCLLIMPFDHYILGHFRPVMFCLSILLAAASMLFVITLGQLCSVLCRKATSAAALCLTILASLWITFPMLAQYIPSIYVGFFLPFSQALSENQDYFFKFSQQSQNLTVNSAKEYFVVIAGYTILSLVMFLLAKTSLRRGIYQQT